VRGVLLRPARPCSWVMVSCGRNRWPRPSPTLVDENNLDALGSRTSTPRTRDTSPPQVSVRVWLAPYAGDTESVMASEVGVSSAVVISVTETVAVALLFEVRSVLPVRGSAKLLFGRTAPSLCLPAIAKVGDSDQEVDERSDDTGPVVRV